MTHPEIYNYTWLDCTIAVIGTATMLLAIVMVAIGEYKSIRKQQKEMKRG